ncbi:MAG: pantoate--beta-alanine ligase [Cyclobacteriaceae bacterium]
MEVIKHPKDIFNLTRGLQKEGKKIGLVPTMGALHLGHFSLIEAARNANDNVVVSIFVNPLQFNREEDLLNYPRTLEQDIESLKSLNVDVLYCPEASDMYLSKPKISIDFGSLADTMEGHFRPGHFSGVGVIVTKLFNQINPDRAYFGLKDLQQFLLIKKMTEELSSPVEVVGLPTARTDSGLARSSRNMRLSKNGLDISANIYQGLQLAKDRWNTHTEVEIVKAEVMEFYQAIDGLEIEYFSIVNPSDLRDLEFNNSQSVAFCVAGYVEGVRLIDNLYLPQD